MCKLGAPYIGHKAAQLLGLSQENLVLVISVLSQEREQLAPRPLLAQGQGDGAEAGD